MRLLQFIIIIFFFFTSIDSISQGCPFNQTCGSNSFSIRFPFQLESGQHSETCGYPGFSLNCSNHTNLLLKLPHSGDFSLRSIDYITQQIQLYDPDGCLPKRLLNFNLSGSPYSPIAHKDYTFLSCPPHSVQHQYTSIYCLSNSRESVLATSSVKLVNLLLSSSCKVITTALVPTADLPEYDDDFVTSDLDEDIQLTWKQVVNCGPCEQLGGTCGFLSNRSHQIGCFNVPKKGKHKVGHQLFWIFSSIILLSPLACTAAAFYVFLKHDKGIRKQNVDIPMPDPTLVVTHSSNIHFHDEILIRTSTLAADCNFSSENSVSPRCSNVSMDLEEFIDSGSRDERFADALDEFEPPLQPPPRLESTMGSQHPRQIPAMSHLATEFEYNSTCFICRQAFNTQETVTWLPRCCHCFHASCIRAWVGIRGTCPVCLLATRASTVAANSALNILDQPLPPPPPPPQFPSQQPVQLQVPDHVFWTLDESTMESKLQMQVSLLPPQLEGSSCPICHEEYQTLETIRWLPECCHHFHAVCVDSWLQTNPTCPMCRLPVNAIDT